MDKTEKPSLSIGSSYATSHRLKKTVRMLFVMFGIGYVLYSFVRTMTKFKEGNILVKEETQSFDKYRYPSATICYKFKHGSKDALDIFYPNLYQKWKTSGDVT